MYLETILVLSGQRATVRAIDVGEYMGYSKPSVSRAMGLLKRGGYVTTAPDGALLLTGEGRRVAEKTYERHRLLSELFVWLGVDEKTAVADACKIEHDISDETFSALKKHAERYGEKR
jgi:Mn-dependent DtxR family transcriptional regulator